MTPVEIWEAITQRVAALLRPCDPDLTYQVDTHPTRPAATSAVAEIRTLIPLTEVTACMNAGCSTGGVRKAWYDEKRDSYILELEV